MRAMILCAGLGTRLRPVTDLWPKPAIPLLGQPLFRSTLATLVRAGIHDVAINTHHLPDVMSYVAQVECDRVRASLQVVHEPVIQGTGGGIRGARAFLSQGHEFVVMNGDVLFGVELAPILAAHRDSGAAATMVLLPMPEGEAYNAVEATSDGRVRRIAGKGPGGEGLVPWHFSGVHVLSPRVFDFMSKEGPEDINRDVYVRMLEAGLTIRGHALVDRGVYWSDLGTPARYGATHQHLLFGQVPLSPFGDANWFKATPKGAGHFHAHPTAVLNDVRVSGPAWFGPECELGPGVRIGAAVSVGSKAQVGAGAHLNRVAVLDGAKVAPGQLIEDSIVMPGGVVVPYSAP